MGSNRKSIRSNDRGQGPFLFIAAIIAIVGLALVVYGVGLVQVHLGSGSFQLERDCCYSASGVRGGQESVHLIGGAAGAVIILIGAALSALGH